jgi:hypothetical protein
METSESKCQKIGGRKYLTARGRSQEKEEKKKKEEREERSLGSKTSLSARPYNIGTSRVEGRRMIRNTWLLIAQKEKKNGERLIVERSCWG